MLIFLLGLLLFFGVHMLPLFPEQRQMLITLLDRTAFVPEPIYKLLFSLISVLGIICIGFGMGLVSTASLWPEPNTLLRVVVAWLMLIACILVVASKTENNIKRYVPHPMLHGISIWGIGHILANSDVTLLLLFFSFVIYAIVAIILTNRRDKSKEKLPLAIVPIAKDGITVGIALLIFLLLLLLHDLLFGTPVFP